MTSLLLHHLPDPVGWIALTPDELRHAQAAAHEVLDPAVTNYDAMLGTPTAALLSANEAARLLAVPMRQLLRLAREGRIAHVRIGKYVRFRPATIIEQGAGFAQGQSKVPSDPGQPNANEKGDTDF
jgi:excisionase family DNA binding protein